MKQETANLYIEKKLVGELQELLEREEIDFYEENIPDDAVLYSITAKFSNGYEADIKVCSGQTNCFVDAVLFSQNGSQIALIDPEADILGDFEFEVNNFIYCASIDER